MSAARRLFLIRHGETVGESSIRFHGATDVALSDLGRAQVRAVAEEVAGTRFVASIQSPMSRARESAEIVLAQLGERPTHIEEDVDLREIDFGRFEGMTDAEIKADSPEWHADWKAGAVAGYPDGDDIARFRERCAAAVRRFVVRHPEGDLLFIAHKGVINAAIHGLCGLPYAELGAEPMDLGSLWVLREGDPWTLEVRNLTGSLEG